MTRASQVSCLTHSFFDFLWLNPLFIVHIIYKSSLLLNPSVSYYFTINGLICCLPSRSAHVLGHRTPFSSKWDHGFINYICFRLMFPSCPVPCSFILALRPHFLLNRSYFCYSAFSRSPDDLLWKKTENVLVSMVSCTPLEEMHSLSTVRTCNFSGIIFCEFCALFHFEELQSRRVSRIHGNVEAKICAVNNIYSVYCNILFHFSLGRKSSAYCCS